MSQFAVTKGVVCFALILLFLSSVAWAQDPNVCDEPGDAPDVIVGEIEGVIRYGSIGGITGFAFGTWSCNIGTCWLNWIAGTNEHPVISQNMFRLKNDRFEHIGQAWLKHGYFALSDELCTSPCIATDGNHLGVDCADPYVASLNGEQTRLGPKFEANASTGYFDYPYTAQGQTGNAIYKRLQVHNVDLDPALNPGAFYYVESQYLTQDDTAAGNELNSTSYRPVTVSGSGGNFTFAMADSIVIGKPAILAWPGVNPSVKINSLDVPGDGRFYLGSQATDLGGGMWHYEYALLNLTSHRSAQSFSVPVALGGALANVGFHDVDYHSGEPYDGKDWDVTLDTSTDPATLTWSTSPYSIDPNANALRWGTLYNFRFDIDAAPVSNNLTVGLFRPGSPGEVTVATRTPGLASQVTPGETSGQLYDELLVTGYNPITGDLSLTFETACETSDNNIYYGPLSEVADYGWLGDVCDIGLSGNYSSFDPGPGSYFFVVVGTKGVSEGSYGTDLQLGGAENEREDFPANTCGVIQNLSNSCE